MSATVRAAYRQSLFAIPDPRFRRALGIAGSVGTVVLALALLSPLRTPPPPRIEDVPERLAKLILEKKAPPPPVLAPSAHVETPQLAAVAEEAPSPEPEIAAPRTETEPALPTPPRRAREETKLDEDRGTAGRAKANAEVTQTLAATTSSVQSTLSSLQSDLASISGGGSANVPERSGGRGRPGRGRSGGEVGGAVAARENVGAGAGGGGTVVTGDLIDIEAVGTGGGGDLASADPGAVAGGAGGAGVAGSYRSNASLLAVVRKYAAGIQFCYDNQLKREPGLEGKMVIVLTVLASGEVSEASIANDSLGSAALRECVLVQVREWKFPAIPEGTVTFRTPFVFTPPN